MKLLLLLSLIGLASCAPALQTVQREQGSLVQIGPSILLKNPGPGPMTGDPSRVGDGPNIAVFGSVDLSLGAPCSLRKLGTWVCPVIDVPEGQQYRVNIMAGSVSGASATFYRAGRNLPIYLELSR
ncbi:hypothetical protein MF271_04930 [Deinococcus sp. KNUC1210]|uniref:hypothetical protein n=1 Tax=Deinococcus sp. KNUC1210 TaxID=2917691 RepID=UPI001EF15CAF|nr:hypothetical protein [Deinococcus sp. KNUC1210]ULH15979.1 hypothetical protein MF271_04930 [Deinococcus sp. KNUC1210]